MKLIRIILYFLLLTLQITICANSLDSIKKEISALKSKEDFQKWFNTLESIPGINLVQKISLSDELILLSQEKEFLFEEAVFKYHKSFFLTEMGNYTYALQLINEVSPVFEQRKSNYLAACYNSAGAIVSRLGDSKLGVEYLNKAILIIKDTSYIKDQEGTKINNYLVLGTIYFSNKKLERARENFLLAEKMCLENISKNSKAYLSVQLNLANLESLEKSYNSGISRCKKVLSSPEINKFQDVKGGAYLNIAALYIKKNDTDSAFYYLQLCEKAANKYGLGSLKVAVPKFRGRLYHKLGNSEMALQELTHLRKVEKEFEEENSKAMANYLLALEKRSTNERLERIKQTESIKQKNLQNAMIVLLISAIVAAFLIILWVQKRKLKQKIKDEKLNTNLVKSQMSAIRSQMNPHFIFNALNSIQFLVLKQEKNKAYDYIEKFAFLIRQVLHYSDQDQIEIEEEINMLDLYLQLEKQRFGDDFAYEISAEEIDGVSIPSMLIQPFVENAMKHGLLHKEGEKKLSINMKVKESILTCEIEDNGIGRKEAAAIKDRQKKKHNSFSVSGTKSRISILQKQYKKDFMLRFEDLHDENHKATGTKVFLEIPCERKF